MPKVLHERIMRAEYEPLRDQSPPMVKTYFLAGTPFLPPSAARNSAGLAHMKPGSVWPGWRHEWELPGMLQSA
jgi:hypothetical protein